MTGGQQQNNRITTGSKSGRDRVLRIPLANADMVKVSLSYILLDNDKDQTVLAPFLFSLNIN